MRPKSREETPKEGSDTATPIANIALHNLRRAAQIASPAKPGAMRSVHIGAKNAAVWLEGNAGGVGGTAVPLDLSHSRLA